MCNSSCSKKAAKQEPKALLMEAYKETICNLTAREERLMEEAACHAT